MPAAESSFSCARSPRTTAACGRCASRRSICTRARRSRSAASISDGGDPRRSDHRRDRARQRRGHRLRPADHRNRRPRGWLQTLDQFGLLTERAVLVEQFTVEQNLAIPLFAGTSRTCPPISRARGGAGRGDRLHAVDLVEAERRPRRPLGRLRLRLGRALAIEPKVLLAEHPNATLAAGRSRTVRRRSQANRPRPRHRGARADRGSGVCASCRRRSARARARRQAH